MNKITPTFLLIFVTILISVSSVSLSNHLAKDIERKQQAKHKDVRLPEQFSDLRKKVDSDPKNTSLRLELAKKVKASADKTQNGQLLMQAVGEYSKILKQDPKQADALRDMAMLCFEHGIIDKALEYFPRYIEVAPDDLAAYVNYSLVLTQNGSFKVAEEQLNKAIAKDKNFFPAYLTLVLVHRSAGDMEAAKKASQKALELAPDEEAKKKVTDILERKTQTQARMDSKSPAAAVSSFFSHHEIIGPKISNITWPDPNTAEINLNNFPIEKMPPFAKQSLTAKTQAMLSELPEKITVVLKDANSGQELLVIK